MTKTFIDTGAWLNFVLKKEPNHQKAKEIFRSIIKDGNSLFTSNDIVDETITRLRYTEGLHLAKKVYSLLRENFQKRLVIQLWTDEKIQHDAWKLLEKFQDHKLSLTDATSIILMNRFHIDNIFTFDSDFLKVGITTLP